MVGTPPTVLLITEPDESIGPLLEKALTFRDIEVRTRTGDAADEGLTEASPHALVLSVASVKTAPTGIIRRYEDSRGGEGGLLVVLSEVAVLRERLTQQTSLPVLVIAPSTGADAVADQIAEWTIATAGRARGKASSKDKPGSAPRDSGPGAGGSFDPGLLKPAAKSETDAAPASPAPAAKTPEAGKPPQAVLESGTRPTETAAEVPPPLDTEASSEAAASEGDASEPPPRKPAEADKGDDVAGSASDSRPVQQAASATGGVVPVSPAAQEPSVSARLRAAAPFVLIAAILFVILVIIVMTNPKSDEPPDQPLVPAPPLGLAAPEPPSEEIPNEGPAAPVGAVQAEAPPTEAPAELAGSAQDAPSSPAPAAAAPEGVPEAIERARALGREVDPLESDRLAAVAHRHLVMGRVAEATETLAEAIALDPDNPRVYAAYGELEIRREDGALAVQWAKRALDRRPSRTEYRLLFADALYARGDVDEARRHWRVLLHDDPDNEELRERIRRSLHRDGEKEEQGHHRATDPRSEEHAP